MKLFNQQTYSERERKKYQKNPSIKVHGQWADVKLNLKQFFLFLELILFIKWSWCYQNWLKWNVFSFRWACIRNNLCCLCVVQKAIHGVRCCYSTHCHILFLFLVCLLLSDYDYCVSVILVWYSRFGHANGCVARYACKIDT